MIVGTDAFRSGDALLVVASGTQLGYIIAIAGQRLSPHFFAGRIMGNVAGTAGTGQTSGKSLYVFCGRRGDVKVVVRGNDLLFIIVACEAQRLRWAAHYSQETVGTVTLEVFADIGGWSQRIPSMGIMAG